MSVSRHGGNVDFSGVRVDVSFELWVRPMSAWMRSISSPRHLHLPLSPSLPPYIYFPSLTLQQVQSAAPNLPHPLSVSGFLDVRRHMACLRKCAYGHVVRDMALWPSVGVTGFTGPLRLAIPRALTKPPSGSLACVAVVVWFWPRCKPIFKSPTMV